MIKTQKFVTTLALTAMLSVSIMYADDKKANESRYQDLVIKLKKQTAQAEQLVSTWKSTKSENEKTEIGNKLDKLGALTEKMNKVATKKSKNKTAASTQQEANFPLEAGTWDAGFKQEKEAKEYAKKHSSISSNLKRTSTW